MAAHAAMVDGLHEQLLESKNRFVAFPSSLKAFLESEELILDGDMTIKLYKFNGERSVLFFALLDDIIEVFCC
jgi:hypothetical protein